MLLITIGKNMATRFSSALRATHVYLQDMGAIVSPSKYSKFDSYTSSERMVGKYLLGDDPDLNSGS